MVENLVPLLTSMLPRPDLATALLTVAWFLLLFRSPRCRRVASSPSNPHLSLLFCLVFFLDSKMMKAFLRKPTASTKRSQIAPVYVSCMFLCIGFVGKIVRGRVRLHLQHCCFGCTLCAGHV